MRGFTKACLFVVFLLLVVGVADAQLIVETFDSETTGSPPAWLWWNNGSSGRNLVDESEYRGPPGTSVELARISFDGKGLGFGRNFPPIERPAELTYYFLVGSAEEEILTALG